MIEEIAKKLYDLFVVNRMAYAIQGKNDTYHTVYNYVTEKDITVMLANKGSIGTYQQLYKSPYMKWICFDYDCRDKENPDVYGLYNSCTKKLNEFLDDNNINYVNEFSGRRGIHTWIIFDSFIKKEIAYEIITAIKRKSNIIYDSEKYGLDEFPKTSVSKGNKLGLQVKIPLSFHVSGNQSFLFFDQYEENKFCDNFLDEQLKILNSIKLNSVDVVLERLEISKEYDNKQKDHAYSRMYIDDEVVEWSLDEIKRILSQTRVYKNIFERFYYGNLINTDRFVMLGTLSKIKGGTNLLLELFEHTPGFSEEITLKQISDHGKKYYPATFQYLYNIYGLEMEAELNPNQNALQYLVEHSEKKIDIKIFEDNEKILLKSSKHTLKKEQNYLFINDEVPVVSVFLDMKNMTSCDIKEIDKAVSKIKRGEFYSCNNQGFFLFERKESENKIRKMVSLNAFDRVLTSDLALSFYYGLNHNIKSFSYNPNYISTTEIFFPWIYMWGNYIEEIRKHIELDIYGNTKVITLDIRHFYDSIDFAYVFKILEEYMHDEEKNIIKWLIFYNETLMRKINNNSRKGVPQGPAYARMIAEAFLGIIIEKVLDSLPVSSKEKIEVYRYVDDIIIFHDGELDSNVIYKKFKNILIENGLQLNKEKSHIYGLVSKLDEKQKYEILRENQIQYGLRQSEYSYLYDNNYFKRKVEDIVICKGGFKVSDISFYFSPYIEKRAKELIFNLHGEQIVESLVGRGSGFSNFYKFVFENDEILQRFIENEYYTRIPINSLNFSCFLAELYYDIVDKKSAAKFKSLIVNYIYELQKKKEDIKEIEDRSIVLAIASLGGDSKNG